MASKIHIFRQSAMEAGTPGKYYINPSPKLMSRASHWRVVEHEDGVELTFNKGAFDGVLYVKGYNNQAVGDRENKDDDFSYIVNTDFLNHREVKAEKKDGTSTYYFPKIKCEIKDAVTKTYIRKIKGDENKKKNKNRKNKKKN